jgi:hypothetical protein
MSKMSQYVFDMQEQATEMSYKEFVLKFGSYFAHVWEEATDEGLMEIVD